VKHDSSAPMIPTPETRETPVVRLRVVPIRAPRARLWTRVQTVTKHERFGEAVLVGVTLLLVGLLFALLDHAVQPRQASLAPLLPTWMSYLPHQ
jgi:hypothetical protein